MTSWVTTGGGSQSLELRHCVKLGGRLGLHEGCSIISHELVSRIWILSPKHQRTRYDDHKEEDKRECGIDDKEDKPGDRRAHSGHTQNVGKNEEADGVEEVEHEDGNVKRVHALVHEGTHDTCGDQSSHLDDDEGNRLNCAVLLAQGDKHALDKDIGKLGHDKVVASCSSDDWVAVSGKGDNLECCQCEGDCDGKEEEDSQDYQGSRVNLSEFPERKNSDGSKAHEGKPKKDAFEECAPLCSEFEEAFLLDPCLFCAQIENDLGDEDEEASKDDEDDEKDIEGDIEENFALDRGNSVDVDGGNRVVWRDYNMEKTSSQQRALLTTVEGLGLEDPVGCSEGRKLGEP
ncbi:hypothetical protein HG531_001276 [Fusarium graminearum]|nr:hypothetical protein HG531_001276 [Fusarium graminearum]